MFSMEMMKKMAKHYAVPEFKENPLQMFAEAVSGKKIVYLYRIASKAATNSGAALAFTTENERTKSKDADSTETKDGRSGHRERRKRITATSILAKEDELVDELEEAMDNDELIEIWEANLEEPASGGDNKFKGMYFQGYLTEIGRSSSAEDFVEIS